MKKQLLLCVMLLMCCRTFCTAQTDANISLKETLKTMSSAHKGITGIAIKHIERNEWIKLNDEHHYPMQSVYKFPLALAILKKVEQKQLSLNQKVHITKSDLHKTWSPIRDKYPKGNIDLSVEDLLRYSVSFSDNNACDILFRLAGGPAAVNDYVHSIGITNIQIAATEHQMHQGWEVQYTNWCTPSAMTEMLSAFYSGKYLSESGTQLLMKLMTESSNSPKRIKGLLPESVAVAHKTGSSGSNNAGMIAATNDAGIITLPDSTHLAITIFVSDAVETFDSNERLIAELAKTVYDHFSTAN